MTQKKSKKFALGIFLGGLLLSLSAQAICPLLEGDYSCQKDNNGELSSPFEVKIRQTTGQKSTVYLFENLFSPQSTSIIADNQVRNIYYDEADSVGTLSTNCFEKELMALYSVASEKIVLFDMLQFFLQEGGHLRLRREKEIDWRPRPIEWFQCIKLPYFNGADESVAD